MKCKVPTETPNTITQTSLQEVFMKKIEIQMQRSKKRTMTVEAEGYEGSFGMDFARVLQYIFCELSHKEAEGGSWRDCVRYREKERDLLFWLESKSFCSLTKGKDPWCNRPLHSPQASEDACEVRANPL